MTADFDRIYGQLHELAPHSRPSTVTEALPIAGNVTTWIVQTFYHDDQPVAFLQSVDASGHVRLVLPPKVVKAIIAQEARLKERLTDRRSEERKRRDAERAKIAQAKRVLAAKRRGVRVVKAEGA